MTWSDLPFKEIHYKKGREYLPVKHIVGKRSELYPTDTSGTLELFQPEASSQGKVIMKIIGKATFPANAQRMLFLISPASKKSKLPLTLMGIEDSLQTFPSGTFRFANFSGKKMSLVLGNLEKDLKPRSIEVYRSKLSPQGGLVTMLIKNSKGQPVFARRLFGQPRDRKLVFITPSSENKSGLKIWILSDIVPKEKPQTP